jgi:hypothetical protein
VYGFEEEADALDLAGIISGEAGVYGVGLVRASAGTAAPLPLLRT